MATAPTPGVPQVEPIACPSCGSRYNPATRELVEDTQLREKIRELETAAQTLRDGNARINSELAAANEKIATLSAAPPAPAPAPEDKKSKFVVGKW